MRPWAPCGRLRESRSGRRGAMPRHRQTAPRRCTAGSTPARAGWPRPWPHCDPAPGHPGTAANASIPAVLCCPACCPACWDVPGGTFRSAIAPPRLRSGTRCCRRRSRLRPTRGSVTCTLRKPARRGVTRRCPCRWNLGRRRRAPKCRYASARRASRLKVDATRCGRLEAVKPPLDAAERVSKRGRGAVQARRWQGSQLAGGPHSAGHAARAGGRHGTSRRTGRSYYGCARGRGSPQVRL